MGNMTFRRHCIHDLFFSSSFSFFGDLLFTYSFVLLDGPVIQEKVNSEEILFVYFASPPSLRVTRNFINGNVFLLKCVLYILLLQCTEVNSLLSILALLNLFWYKAELNSALTDIENFAEIMKCYSSHRIG